MQPILFIPIGASGSGKSTFREKLLMDNPNLSVFSLDDLRLEWYVDGEEDGEYSHKEAYNKAFERACDDNQFASRANARYMEMIKTGDDLYIDNTNISAKRRRFYITEARRRGYYIQAIIFPIELQELIDRQSTRTDKNVPIHAVQRMYMSLQLPSYGDFDGILVSPANL
jgi:predicted kinase